jgi:hypothetical protein
LTVTIPADAKTYVWVARVLLTDYFGALLPDNVWTITITGEEAASVRVAYQYGGSIKFTGGENYEDLVGVSLELHIYNASTGDEVKKQAYTITYKFPSGSGPDNKIQLGDLPNGESEEYYWMIMWNDPAVTGKYRIKIYVEGTGEETHNKYTTWSDNTCTFSQPSNCNVGDRYLDVAVTR